MLSVAQLSVTRGGHRVLDRLDLQLRAGEMVALVGESGAGKTSAALAILRLLPPGAAAGTARLNGVDLLRLPERDMRVIRGARIGAVFQDALAALNPAHRVGSQIAEPLRIHHRATRREARIAAERALAEMGLPDPAGAARAYPHELSGGQRQRAMIAAALVAAPEFLIADEPTSGLDSENAASLLARLADLRRRGLGVLLITHDLARAAAHADAVHVLYAGRCVERQPAAAFFAHPRHPYSRALLAALPAAGALPTPLAGTPPDPAAPPPGCRFAPRCEGRRPECEAADPPWTGVTACLYPHDNRPKERQNAPATLPSPGAEILRGEGVAIRYPRRAGWALRGVSWQLRRGECLGVVGESGSGKTTLGRAMLGLVSYEGTITMPGGWSRRRVQPVFQDPAQSLNPRFTVAQAIAEPLMVAGMPRAERETRAAARLRRVGLPERLLSQPVSTLSGGQAQRVAIARALAAEADVIVLDEPASALDASSAAGLLHLFLNLMEAGTALVLISHDVAAVQTLSRNVLHLHQGRSVS